MCDSQITLKSRKKIAHFKNLRESQTDYPLETDSQLLALANKRKPDDSENELNQIIQDIHFQKLYTDNGRSDVLRTRQDIQQRSPPILIFPQRSKYLYFER